MEAIQAAGRRGSVHIDGALALVRGAALATINASEAKDGGCGFEPHPILEDILGQVRTFHSTA